MLVRSSKPGYYIEYDAQLVEEAVLLGLAGLAEETPFRLARNQIYEIADGEDRERKFGELHAAWFVRLGLERPIQRALEEQPTVMQKTRFGRVARAAAAREAGADLHEVRDPHAAGTRRERMILIRLNAGALLDAASLQIWLRHELMHIADMLDPAFGYEPQIPKSEVGPVYDNLLRERYRVLWDTYIDGRLWRRGWAAEGVRAQRLAEFIASFPMCGQEAPEKFHQWFDAPAQTHSHLIAFARHPEGRGEWALAGRSAARGCPICRLPTFTLLTDNQSLPVEALQAIATDRTDWRPDMGLCLQCADLYRARGASMGGAMAGNYE